MLALTSSMANAEYLIKIPLEQSQGGNLPNNEIVFVSSTEVVPETPVKHEPVDCLTNPTDNPQLCEKSLTAWIQFANDRGLSKTWKNLQWGGWGLSYIPNEPYPTTRVGELYLNNNQLTNVDGLINLTSVNTLLLDYNKLTNVNGLINLTRVNTLSFYRSNLTNVDGLINLKSATALILTENPLTNVNGLANLKVSGYIMVDRKYSGTKLAANTRFCTQNSDGIFYTGYAQKSKLCESP